MASIIPNFEYDIFISYRHKDNKGDHWVTEFVSALKTEIEATFKEDISIYFDANPHDGLLETHDVDDSLKDKLKCLIFIPIISRTYCDPKSFAWNQEFLPFLKMAADDSIGLKVKLPNGNTASRVLPIRIHELDANDKAMIESELQGVLRAIDFTYKAAGINRPLLSKDDEAIKTSGQATYRDQINKTANAISDLIAGMQGKVSTGAENASGSSNQSEQQTKLHRKRSLKIPVLSNLQIAIAFLTVSLLLLAIISVVHFSESNVKPTYKTTILSPDNTKFKDELGGNLALSPDGTMLAFVAVDSLGNSLLYLRFLSTTEARALKNTEGALRPFWSPDNRFIGFFTGDNKLKKIDISNGSVIAISNASSSRGGSWNQGDVIIFSSSDNPSIFRVSANGGTSTPVTRLDTTRHESAHRWPIFLPDGKHFFFSTRINRTGSHKDDAIFVASLDSTFVPKMLTKATSNLAYVNGYLIYHNGATLVAHLFDSDKLQLMGDAITIVDHVSFDALSSHAGFSVSQNGILAYHSGFSKDSGTDFIWRSRNGNRIGGFRGSSIYADVNISPDGTKVAIKEWNLKKDGQDIWIYEIGRDAWTRFTVNGRNFTPVWSPDSKMIAYGSHVKNPSGRYPLYVRAASGAGDAISILESKFILFPNDWSSDGKYISYNTSLNNSADLWILPMSSSGDKVAGQSFPFLQSDPNESSAAFSPDGKWIAYHSNESGRFEIYIRPFPGPGGKWQVSTKGGGNPKWRGDGKELFFNSLENNNVMSAEIKTSGSSIEVRNERVLFKLESDIYDYHVTNDGQKFLFNRPHLNDASMPVTLVVNWLEELKKDQ